MNGWRLTNAESSTVIGFHGTNGGIESGYQLDFFQVVIAGWRVVWMIGHRLGFLFVQHC